MKLSKNPLFLIGIIFAPIGSIFVIIGLAIALSFYFNGGTMTVNGVLQYYEPGTMGTGPIMFLSIFGGIGLIFVILGLIFLICSINKRNSIKRLLDNNEHVTARIIDVIQNHNLRINGMHPFHLVCQYDDVYGGRPHVFQSDYIMYHPGDVKDFTVKVYVDKSNWNKYYVDIDSMTNNMGY